MGKLVDLSGRTFGLLTVLQRVEDRKPGRPMSMRVWEDRYCVIY